MTLKLALFYVVTALMISGCATFESRFTSETGCPEEQIKVLKRTNNLIGNQSYTVSCRGKKYYCTENFLENQHSNLKCKAESK